MTNTDFGIREPIAAALLIAIALAGAVVWWGRAQTAKVVRRLGIGPVAPARYVFVLLGVSLLLTGSLLRPYWGSEDITVHSSGGEVVFLVDVSRSMFARDVPPSRMELAKRKMLDMLEQFGKQGESTRFGITVFAGDAYTICPVTSDQAVVKQFIDLISPDLVSSLGSNLTAGLTVALSRLQSASSQGARIILLSDGEDSTLQGNPVISEIRKKGVRIDALGIGTTTGAEIQLPNGTFVTDQSRKPVVSKLIEGPLREVADASGGIYMRATLDDRDVVEITKPAQLLANAKTSHQSRIRTYREFGSWIALGALVILLLGAIVRGRSALILSFLVVLAHIPHTQAQDSPQSLLAQTTSPFHLYERGLYEAAATSFADALKATPDDRMLKQGLASSLYKLGRYQESESIFSELARTAQNGRSYFESTYNEGNAQLAQRRYQDAIDSFQKALDVKPDDQQATHNLQVARALLNQEKTKPTPTPTPTSPPNPSPDPTQSPSDPPSPSPSSSPQETPSGSPSPSDSASPETSPSPGASPSPGGNEQTPSASPSPNQSPDETPGNSSTAVPAGSPSPLASASPAHTIPSPSERLKEAIETPASEAANTIGATPTPPPQTFNPGEREANAWLESLPDSPLLIRRHRGTSQGNSQTW
jgi:Ca-activated chloride channel family protein